jgi:hypothetical protein
VAAALNFQSDAIGQHFGNASRYDFGSGTAPMLRDRLPLRLPISLARAGCGSPLSSGAISGLCQHPPTIQYILRQVIGYSRPGDTITFGITGTITWPTSALNIGKELTVQGPNKLGNR